MSHWLRSKDHVAEAREKCQEGKSNLCNHLKGGSHHLWDLSKQTLAKMFAAMISRIRFGLDMSLTNYGKSLLCEKTKFDLLYFYFYFLQLFYTEHWRTQASGEWFVPVLQHCLQLRQWHFQLAEGEAKTIQRCERNLQYNTENVKKKTTQRLFITMAWLNLFVLTLQYINYN